MNACTTTAAPAPTQTPRTACPLTSILPATATNSPTAAAPIVYRTPSTFIPSLPSAPAAPGGRSPSAGTSSKTPPPPRTTPPPAAATAPYPVERPTTAPQRGRGRSPLQTAVRPPRTPP